jgi:hypothetical protein
MVNDLDSFLIKSEDFHNLHANSAKKQILMQKIDCILTPLFEKDMDNMRGAILELLGFKLLCNKYCGNWVTWDFSHKHFDKDCYVLINNENDSWKSNKTIDILFYDISENHGECYECKIGGIFDEIDISNLNDIYHKSKECLLTGVMSINYHEVIHVRLIGLKKKVRYIYNQYNDLWI